MNVGKLMKSLSIEDKSTRVSVLVLTDTGKEFELNIDYVDLINVNNQDKVAIVAIIKEAVMPTIVLQTLN